MEYEELFKRSVEDPEGFWADAAEGISWYKRWDKVLDGVTTVEEVLRVSEENE